MRIATVSLQIKDQFGEEDKNNLKTHATITNVCYQVHQLDHYLVDVYYLL